MQCKNTTEIIFLVISVLALQQQGSNATPVAQQREVRQTKGPNNSDATEADVKTLGGQLLLGGQMVNQPQGLLGFGNAIGSLPYARYGGLAFGGSLYPNNPGMSLLGWPFGGGVGTGTAAGAAPGLSALQQGNTAGLGYAPTTSYVGNTLTPYPINGPEMYPNYMLGNFPQQQNNFSPVAATANNFDNLANLANLQGVAPLTAGPMQQTQQPFQGRLSQLQPQLGASYSYPSPYFGQMGGYGAGFQPYQM